MRRLAQCAALILVVFAIVACEAKDSTGGGKGQAGPTNPPVTLKDRTPPESTRDVAAEIDALPAGDLDGLVALLADTAGKPQEVWIKKLPELAKGLSDDLMPDLLLAAPVVEAAPSDVVRRAWVLLDARDALEAENAVGTINPGGNGEASLVRAFCNLELGRSEAARANIGEAVATGLPAGVRDLAAGRLLAKQGDLKRAEEVLRGAADPRAYGPYAMVLLANGAKPANALAEADQVFSGCPNDPPSQKTRLMLLTLAGDFEAALAAYAELSEASPDDPSVFELGGDLHAMQKDLAAAGEAYRRALELDPGSAVAHRNLASILFAEGNREGGYDHLEAAIATAPKDGVIGLFNTGRGVLPVLWQDALCRQLCGLAVRHLAGDEGREQAEKYLRMAIEVKPTVARPFVILSEMRLRAGDLKGAIEVLEEGARPVSGGEDRSELLLRLAVRKLMAGDLEGYRELVGGISVKTPIGRMVSRLGEPAPGGLIVLPGRPNCRITLRQDRFNALAEAVFGPEAKAADRTELLAMLADRGITASVYGGFDIEETLKAGIPILLDRTVLSEDGAQLELALIVGYDPGLGAFLMDGPDPTSAVLIDEERVKGSLFYCANPDGFTPADEGKGAALAKAIGYLRRAELSDAFEALPMGYKHPISSFVRSRAALVTGRGTIAEEILRIELTESPDNPIWHLLYAQTLLVNGEQEAARHAVERAAELAYGFHGSVLYRRLMALSLITPDSEEATVEALKKILVDRPDYLAVYQDLAGVYLSRGRFMDAYLVLVELGRKDPSALEEPGYQQAVKNVMGGLATNATTAEELEPLIESGDIEIRELVVRVAPRLTYDDAVKVLTRMTRDPEADIRTLSLRYIGVKRFQDAAEAVKLAITDESPLVRGAAAQALRGILDREAGADLVRLLADEDAYVREVALNELKALAGKDFGFDPRAPEAERKEAARRWEAWLKER